MGLTPCRRHRGRLIRFVLWLLRHAEAEEGSPDADRTLTERGREQARVAGAALAALGVELDASLASPKVRALETAKIACEQLDGVDVKLEPKLGGGPFDAEALAAGLGDEVMLVGHDPDFSMAVHDLTGAQVRLKKGGLAGIEKGELNVLLRPSELAAIAGG
jgi:phosphohistidine phosphatase